ncbi:MAG: zf-HC2 domain-containing protein [Planctomycetes bacterium]|nr:zf-HC2 domain-containing protein [Planctomycetota bacterium]
MDQKCEEIQLSLVAFLRGELDPVESGAVAAHLTACSACGALADELREVLALVHTLPEAPADLTARLLAAVEAVAHDESSSARLRRLVRDQVPPEEAHAVDALLGETPPPAPGQVLTPAARSIAALFRLVRRVPEIEPRQGFAAAVFAAIDAGEPAAQPVVAQGDTADLPGAEPPLAPAASFLAAVAGPADAAHGSGRLRARSNSSRVRQILEEEAPEGRRKRFAARLRQRLSQSRYVAAGLAGKALLLAVMMAIGTGRGADLANEMLWFTDFALEARVSADLPRPIPRVERTMDETEYDQAMAAADQPAPLPAGISGEETAVDWRGQWEPPPDLAPGPEPRGESSFQAQVPPAPDPRGLAPAAAGASAVWLAARQGHGEAHAGALGAAAVVGPRPSETAAALARGLEYLRASQNRTTAPGSWDAAGGAGGDDGRVETTALALLAFLGEGHTTNLTGAAPTPRQQAVNRGIEFLLSRVAGEGAEAPGRIDDRAEVQAVAVEALAENLARAFAAGATVRERGALLRRLDYLRRARLAISHLASVALPAGGWPAEPGGPGDLRVTWYAARALHVAGQVGALRDVVPPTVFHGAARLLSATAEYAVVTDPNTDVSRLVGNTGSAKMSFGGGGGAGGGAGPVVDYGPHGGLWATAAGALLRALLIARGDVEPFAAPLEAELADRQAIFLVTTAPPSYVGAEVDQEFWRLAAPVLARSDTHRPAFTKWTGRLRREVIEHPGDDGAWLAPGAYHPRAAAYGAPYVTALTILAAQACEQAPW